MSTIDTLRAALTRLVEKAAALRDELRRHETNAAAAIDAARAHDDRASRASSPATANSARNAAKREREKSLQHSRRATDVAKKIGQNSRDQDSRRSSLDAAQKSHRQAAEREERQRVQKEKSDRQKRDREDVRRRQVEKSHAREVAQLSAPQVHFVHIRPPEPERLRVLYLTAGAGTDLRTDVEIRQVQQALRGARFRDLVTVEQRPAATFQDLLDGLNDVTPHIVHFSGHGVDEGLIMDDGGIEGETGTRISFSMLVKALEATDAPPTLLVLNACSTLEGSEVILPAVPVLIAMADEILDVAAIIFAQQFYAALASGQSVGSALRQAKVAMEAAMLEDGAETLPTCISREDVDVDTLILVRALG